MNAFLPLVTSSVDLNSRHRSAAFTLIRFPDSSAALETGRRPGCATPTRVASFVASPGCRGCCATGPEARKHVAPAVRPWKTKARCTAPEGRKLRKHVGLRPSGPERFRDSY